MIIEADLTNVYQSVAKHLFGSTYTKGANTKTLAQFYSGLKIIGEYPQDLETISLPTIALSSPDEQPLIDEFYGDGYAMRYDFTIYGFSGGETTDQLNLFQRDNLRNDLKHLLEGSYINLYSFPDLTLLGTMDIIDVSSRSLPSNVNEIRADRFKFIVDFATIIYGN